MRRHLVTALPVFAAMGAFAVAAQFRSFDLIEQVAGSDLIILGTVRSLRSVWDGDRGTAFTDAEISLDEVWKGSPPQDSITVRTAGGEVGQVRVDVDGAATFANGERVLLFLRWRNGIYRPWGMRFGKYTVERAGSSTYVIGPLPPSASVPYPVVSISLEELREQVEDLVGSGR